MVVSSDMATVPSYEKFADGYERKFAASGSSVLSGIDLNVKLGARGIRK